MKTRKIILGGLIILTLFYAVSVQAVCPVCTVAMGAGLGLSRWLGINDSVTGLWIGALIVSLIIWTITWLDKKNFRFLFRNLLVVIGYYLLIIVPFYYAKIIANPIDFLCSCANDLLLIGIIQGSATFFFAAALYEYLKEKNNGRAHFPYEKVAIPILFLVLFTVVFYLLTK